MNYAELTNEQLATIIRESSPTKDFAAISEAAMELAKRDKAEKEKAAEAQREVDAKAAKIAAAEKLRDAPEPLHHCAQRGHMQAIAKCMEEQIAASDELKGNFSVVVTEPKKTVTESDDGPKVHWESPSLHMVHRAKFKVYCYIDFRAEEKAGSSWSRRVEYTGRMRMNIGSYGDRLSLPQRKTGEYDYDKAATKLLSDAYRAEREVQKAMAINSNQKARDELRKEFGLTEYSDVVCTERSHGSAGRYETFAAPVGMLYVKLDKLMTPEQARAVLAAAAAAGLKL